MGGVSGAPEDYPGEGRSEGNPGREKNEKKKS